MVGPGPGKPEVRSSPYARNPSIAVNKDGIPGILFYDGREGSSFMDNFRCQRVYFTASLDDGESWLPEIPVSAEPSCPASPANGMAGFRWPAGGDYHGLTALPDGSFRLVWSDSRSGVFILRTATVIVKMGSE